MTSRRSFIGLGVVAACACAAATTGFAQPPQPAPPGSKFVCPPCGCEADGKEFDAPGVCPAPSCGMTLIPKAPPAPKAQGAGTLP